MPLRGAYRFAGIFRPARDKKIRHADAGLRPIPV
jgi:hypothetical protein